MNPTTPWRPVVILVSLLAATLAGATAPGGPSLVRLHAATTGEGQPATTVSIGEGTAAPGTEVKLPITLSAADSVRVGAIDIRLVFPKALLEFLSVEPSAVAGALGADVRGKAEAGPGDDSLLLHVRIAKSPAGEPLPAGRLAQLAFRIAPTARANSFISLAPEVSAQAADAPPRPIAPIVALKTRIAVTIPPVSACFFYMH